ncbi:Dolichyl-diphosphooligosaccharide-protein glycosyltransferase subunit dad1 [Yamadazyma tenuis]|uniref:DASH complex subunit DAD1 n=1 Tax=Candida tenuis (strain ATCC 10573 / BCRC 21748 / CBS 615 / JCM 9827 / NBRC 10315 / NRRL Y-1498 / VKM Y-70) TaxID=590646 RepID=G3B3Q6_CANTC|nr:uncharacterized protein CANTEDRAFT_114277 [Yamadazyma tenuis ATCC 10573]XP_006686744.1 uncharacterized protein CANTEDRAFT_114277 [Yamadazyma tenuis ATCC 10573]EGV64429.1 hypothetical protein CANTEDRAFT_114277 [Yamadazyma tenuis ATCC 10573]EGV64430.1 hypothetical protein CANTEDRAFT_114277 [Yamadazyma tenuis ATCC 10573]WEJ96125.1 Dolichyl-diphosphooligosaccharide-protein glycosyltransferase subunit dad1 [Yamadazyma tenuis]
MSDFEKYRDTLIQEISNSINSIVLNLNTLNRSLHNSIQVSKEFDNVSDLWANFYSGLKKESGQQEPEEENEVEGQQDTQGSQEA